MKTCDAEKEFAVGHETITFRCEKQRGRHSYHRAGWGLAAEVVWFDLAETLRDAAKKRARASEAPQEPTHP